jgi:hypothetical protein
MTRLHRRLALVVSATAQVLIASSVANAQSQSQDTGVFLIFQNGELIGREEFAVRRGTSSATVAGFTLASTALYPSDRPEHTLVSVIELGPDSLPIASRFERANDDMLRVAIGIGQRRIAVRRATGSGESAREYPVRGRPVVIDDSVFVPLAIRPPETDHAAALSAAGEVGADVQIRHLGSRETLLAGDLVDLDEVQIQTPSGPLTAWYDDRGRLMKVEWPDRRIAVLRQSER